MEAKLTELNGHTKGINAALTEACIVPSSGPLVRVNDLIVSTFNSGTLSRRVTSDLGSSEFAVRLPIPDANEPRFWIAMHERWGYKNKLTVRFLDCGLRLYVGSRDEEAVQVMRLEWVAPKPDHKGIPVYDGKHAGHPHWHIDRAALVGPEDYLRSLDILTAPDSQNELQDFSESTARPERRFVYDCSWIMRMHLPAQARWMDLEWKNSEIPGPHQSEPSDIAALGRWWAGSLRYFAAELPKVVPYL
jgi:hypothetical protein